MCFLYRKEIFCFIIDWIITLFWIKSVYNVVCHLLIELLFVYSFHNNKKKARKLDSCVVNKCNILSFSDLLGGGDSRMWKYFIIYTIGVNLPFEQLSNKLEFSINSKSAKSIIEIISYSSMMMYLFHRQILACGHYCGIHPLISLGLIFVMGFALQILYDKIIGVFNLSSIN